jgi:hypothetical protein
VEFSPDGTRLLWTHHASCCSSEPGGEKHQKYAVIAELDRLRKSDAVLQHVSARCTTHVENAFAHWNKEGDGVYSVCADGIYLHRLRQDGIEPQTLAFSFRRPEKVKEEILGHRPVEEYFKHLESASVTRQVTTDFDREHSRFIVSLPRLDKLDREKLWQSYDRHTTVIDLTKHTAVPASGTFTNCEGVRFGPISNATYCGNVEPGARNKRNVHYVSPPTEKLTMVADRLLGVTPYIGTYVQKEQEFWPATMRVFSSDLSKPELPTDISDATWVAKDAWLMVRNSKQKLVLRDPHGERDLFTPISAVYSWGQDWHRIVLSPKRDWLAVLERGG